MMTRITLAYVKYAIHVRIGVVTRTTIHHNGSEKETTRNKGKSHLCKAAMDQLLRRR